MSPSEVGRSVVIVTWQCADHLGRLVDSMNRFLDPATEVIVVDNDSDDDPEGAAGRWRGPGRFIRLDSNRGFGAANNVGVAEAGGDSVVLLNPDTELIDGTLAGLVDAAIERRALVGPRLLDSDGTIQPSAAGPVVGPWPWVKALTPAALQPSGVRARTDPWRLGAPTPVTWLRGACIAAPTSVLLGLGPFDESIHMYGEDLDLGLRAEAAGVPRFFDPGVCAIVHHAGGSSGRRYDDGGIALATGNRRLVIRRAYGEGRARRAWRADVANYWLRSRAKAVLRRGAEREAAYLRGTMDAGRAE